MGKKYVVIWSDGCVFESDLYSKVSSYLEDCKKDKELMENTKFKLFEISENEIKELEF